MLCPSLIFIITTEKNRHLQTRFNGFYFTILIFINNKSCIIPLDQLENLMYTNKKLQGEQNYGEVNQQFVTEELNKINKKYEFPAYFKKAKIHKRAMKFGYNAPKVEKKSKDKAQQKSALTTQKSMLFQQVDGMCRPKLCACCNQAINTHLIDLSYPTTSVKDQTQPFQLSSSTAMFFSFIKMSIYYLLLVFLVCGIFNLVTSIGGNYCLKHQQICSNNIFEILSTYNKFKQTSKMFALKIQDVLSLIVVIMSIFFFLYYRSVQYDLYGKIERQIQTQDDFTIFVEGIPILDFQDNIASETGKLIQFDYEQKLKETFQHQILVWIDWMNGLTQPEGNIEQDLINILSSKNKVLNDLKSQNKVTTVSLCFDLNELQKVQKQREQLMDQQVALHKQQMKSVQYSLSESNNKKVRGQIEQLNKIQVELCRQFATDNSPIFNITHFVGKAFVSFEYQHYMEYIMQKYEDKTLRIFQPESVYGRTFKISRAQHPTDIYWTNLSISDESRTYKVITSFLIILMVLVFSAFALVGLDLMKKDEEKSQTVQQQDLIIDYALSIASSVLATLINFAIGYVIVGLTEYQKHKTRTNKLASQIVKMLITQFINTAFIFYMIQVIDHRPYLSSAGLVIQVSFLIIVSGFISIGMNAVNIPFFLRKITLLWKYGYRGSKQNMEDYIPTFQIKLNREFQYPVFNIAERYSYYLLQVYTCMFYSYLIPIGVLAVAFIFCIQYWIDKIKLFRFSSQFPVINYFLSRTILKIFESSILFYSLGNFLFSIVLQKEKEKQWNLLNIISLGISFIYVCFITFAPSNIERKIFGQYETFEKFSYSECFAKHKFYETYWTENPGTVFIKQLDINDKKSYIEQGTLNQYFDAEDVFLEIYDLNQIGQKLIQFQNQLQ